MKGIKECVNWMFENQDKWLCNESGDMLKFDGVNFWSSTKDSEVAGSVNQVNFVRIKMFEWQEYKTPYTFEEAYKLCKEEKDVCFNSEFGVFMGNMAGEIYLNSRESTDDEHENVLSCKWYKS